MGKSIEYENLDGETQKVFALMEKYKENMKQLLRVLLIFQVYLLKC